MAPTVLARAAAVVAAAVAALAGPAVAHAADATPLENAHAHNDYLHARPLLDALDQGFTSVEADVWLKDGQLCLGHAAPDCRKTLEKDYLAPLEARAAARGGTVYAGWTGTFQLLIDLKTDGTTTWPAVETALAAHPTLMTHWSGTTRTPGPVMAVISGKRGKLQMLVAPQRWSAYDGDLDDLGTGLSPEFMPLVSADWWATFSWRGGYALPADQRARLQDYAQRAHADGARLRFYGTPDLTDPVSRLRRANVWAAELAAGVDLLNSDDLAGLGGYLRAR